MAVALVSILAQDRVGLVSEVADHLFDAGVNLGDTTFAVLGSGAESTAVCELPNGLASKGSCSSRRSGQRKCASSRNVRPGAG